MRLILSMTSSGVMALRIPARASCGGANLSLTATGGACNEGIFCYDLSDTGSHIK